MAGSRPEITLFSFFPQPMTDRQGAGRSVCFFYRCGSFFVHDVTRFLNDPQKSASD
jgi:hypothetical protein